MDNLDVRIIRGMLESRATSPLDFSMKKSLSALARQIKVDENTVKNRITKLYETKFLKGWWVAVNPNLVGQQMAQIWIDVKDTFSKEQVIEKISLIQGVAVVKNLFGSWLGIVFYHEGELALKKTRELISKIAESDDMIYTNEPFPHCNVSLSGDDLKIIRALQRNPMKSFVEIAKELGLSARTIKRRITKLSNEEAVYLVGELDPKFVSGGIISGLLVFYSSPEGRQKANDALLDYLADQLIFANLDDTQHGYFAIMIPNIAQAKEILRRALAVPGVSNGRIDLVEEIEYHYEVYEEQLEKLERSLDYSSRRQLR